MSESADAVISSRPILPRDRSRPYMTRKVHFHEGQSIWIRRASFKDPDRAMLASNFDIPNTHMSKHHALVKLEGGNFYISDNGLRFGTILNGALVGSHPLRLQNEDMLGLIVVKASWEIAHVRQGCLGPVRVNEIFNNPEIEVEFKVLLCGGCITLLAIPSDHIERQSSPAKNIFAVCESKQPAHSQTLGVILYPRETSEVNSSSRDTTGRKSVPLFISRPSITPAEECLALPLPSSKTENRFNSFNNQVCIPSVWTPLILSHPFGALLTKDADALSSSRLSGCFGSPLKVHSTNSLDMECYDKEKSGIRPGIKHITYVPREEQAEHPAQNKYAPSPERYVSCGSSESTTDSQLGYAETPSGDKTDCEDSSEDGSIRDEEDTNNGMEKKECSGNSHESVTETYSESTPWIHLEKACTVRNSDQTQKDRPANIVKSVFDEIVCAFPSIGWAETHKTTRAYGDSASKVLNINAGQFCKNVDMDGSSEQSFSDNSSSLDSDENSFIPGMSVAKRLSISSAVADLLGFAGLDDNLKNRGCTLSDRDDDMQIVSESDTYESEGVNSADADRISGASDIGDSTEIDSASDESNIETCSDESDVGSSSDDHTDGSSSDDSISDEASDEASDDSNSISTSDESDSGSDRDADGYSCLSHDESGLDFEKFTPKLITFGACGPSDIAQAIYSPVPFGKYREIAEPFVFSPCLLKKRGSDWLDDGDKVKLDAKSERQIKRHKLLSWFKFVSTEMLRGLVYVAATLGALGVYGYSKGEPVEGYPHTGDTR